MTRKKSKILRGLLALAMTLVLCLGSATAVFASPITGDETNPAQAAITKMLEMPLGTTVPSGATFTFEIDKVGLDGDNGTAATGAMPAIANKTVTFDGTETDASTATVKKVYQEVNVFSGVTWPRAGIYHYTIKETASISGYTLNAATETLAYAANVYDIFAYVDNGAGGLYIKHIAAQTGTPGTPGTPGSGTKVNPSPGTPGTPGSYSQMIFTNSYSKTSGPNPANSPLEISKVVTGAMASQSFYFNYSLTVTQPAVVTVPQTYKVYVMEGATVVTDATLNGVTIAGTDTYGPYFNATSGTSVAFKLKHGQRLAFGNLHTGASYTVTEQAAADWTPNYTLTVNGGTPTTTTNTTANTSMTVPSTVIGDTGANKAAYSNAWKTITPTGLDINDMPFILMLVLAAGAVVAFVVVKYRRKKAQSYNS